MTVSNSSYETRRHCRECHADTRIVVTLLPDAVHLECSECGAAYDLPSYRTQAESDSMSRTA